MSGESVSLPLWNWAGLLFPTTKLFPTHLGQTLYEDICMKYLYINYFYYDSVITQPFEKQ